MDRYFLKHGVRIKSLGIYQGVKEDFNTFAVAQTNWFLKVVDKWYTSYFGDTLDSPEYRADALDSYYRIKKQTDNYFKKHKIYN